MKRLTKSLLVLGKHSGPFVVVAHDFELAYLDSSDEVGIYNVWSAGRRVAWHVQIVSRAAHVVRSVRDFGELITAVGMPRESASENTEIRMSPKNATLSDESCDSR